jgi:carboxylesterase type B
LAEDCLYLNIWSPVDQDKENESESSGNQKKSLRPVMLWFFGGGYSGGSNNLDEFDGRVLSALGDVVVITANYRVGPFGFLDLGVNDSPGNQGLYDNKEALLWTRRNVKAFGGDPEQITVFGQSAGAITTGLFMVNNHTSSLFKRAILQSGSPVMLNFFFSRVEDTAERFVTAMNCTATAEAEPEDMEAVESTSPTEEAADEPTAEDKKDFQAFIKKRNEELSCLNSKTTQEILEGQQQLMSTAFPFTPSPFEDFLPMMATDALKAEPGSKNFIDSFNNVQDVLIGSNSDEGSVILHLEIPEIFEEEKIHLNITTLAELKDLLVTNFSKEFNIDQTTANLFANIFFSSGPTEDSTTNLIKRLYEVIGGLAFTCPVAMFAEGLTARGVNVYEYEFGYRSSASPWGSWMGVTHGDEYIFTFGHPLRYPNKYSAQDSEVSKRMIETWTHFARTGRVPKQNDKKWPKFTRERGDFMKINLNNSRVSYKIQDNVCSLFSVGLDSFRRRRRQADFVSSRMIQIVEAFAKYSTL